MQLGMVGLGRMGANMTERLRAAGHDLKTFDPNVEGTASSLEELVQQLDAPPTNLRFRTKTWAVIEGERQAQRLHGELIVLNRSGRITCWESFGTPTTRNQDWIGRDRLTG